jgi:tetratricopeptide (TPR) repeat protein
MNRTILSIIFLLLVKTSLSQQSYQKIVDSLSNSLQRHIGSDTIRLNLYINLAINMRGIDSKKSLLMADSAIKLAGLLKDKHKLGLSYNAKSLVLYQTGDFSKGADMANTAVEIFKKLNDTKERINSLNTGVGHLTQLARYTEALDRLHEILRIIEPLNDKNKTANAYGNIGVIYLRLKKYEEAIQYYNKAGEIFLGIKDSLKIALVYGNIGSAYLEKGDYAKAIESNLKAYTINSAIAAKKGMANNLLDIGSAYGKAGEYLKGLEYLKQALKLYDEIGAINNLSLVNSYIADIIMRMPENLLRNHVIPVANRNETALYYQIRAIEMARKTKDIEMLSKQLYGLHDIYLKQNKYKKALEAYKEHVVINDSALSNKEKNEIELKQLQFENEKEKAVLEERHNAEVNREKDKKKVAITVALLIVIASAFVFIFYRKRQVSKAKQQEAELKAEIADTEMKVMRLQMNPHFIFNSLNSISDYIRRNNAGEADEYLSKFARVMRMTLENSEQQAISLQDDLKALELYMQLETKRLNDKFTYEIKVADDIDKENTLVPPMIFQPFVENSIWHGISKKEGKGHILITISKEGEMLHCTIDDDGIGRQQSALISEGINKEKQSLGMKITKARIDMLNKLKGSKADIIVTDKGKGLKAELILPLRTSF